MTFVVTGGAGFVGSFLVDKLLLSGEPVRVIDDGSTGSTQRRDPRVETHKVDISTLGEADWAELLLPGDTVFHLAARKLNTPGVSDSDLIGTNIAATVALARGAKRKKAKRLVFASSLYVYGHQYLTATDEDFLPLPQTLYGMTKLAGEHSLSSLLDPGDTEWVAARFYFVYGPKQYPGAGYKSVIVKNFERIRDGKAPLICGSGEQELDYVFVDDAVSALLAMSERAPSGAVYNVSSGETVSIRDLTFLMLEVAGHPTQMPIFIEPDWTDGTIRGASHAKLSQDLGWSPQTSLKEGLERTWLDILTQTEN